ncbi:MAG: SAM-dependent methyltransferase, partial [Actinomycetota bacterium]
MSGLLSVVGTPIGNLDDLSPRAARALESADLIACEDTRVTRRLLSARVPEARARFIAYHARNE